MKKKKTNRVAIEMMQVFVKMFNNCFVYYCLIFIIFLCLNCFSYTYQLLFGGYKAWIRLITVLVQFKFPLDVIWRCCYYTAVWLCISYASVKLLLFFYYVYVMLILCFYYVYRMLLLCFCYFVVAVLWCYCYVFTEMKF